MEVSEEMDDFYCRYELDEFRKEIEDSEDEGEQNIMPELEDVIPARFFDLFESDEIDLAVIPELRS
jgi:hypothetical protein